VLQGSPLSDQLDGAVPAGTWWPAATATISSPTSTRRGRRSHRRGGGSDLLIAHRPSRAGHHRPGGPSARATADAVSGSRTPPAAARTTRRRPDGAEPRLPAARARNLLIGAPEATASRRDGFDRLEGRRRDDRVDARTAAGASETSRPPSPASTRSRAIACGAGHDVVDLLDGDLVARDCEWAENASRPSRASGGRQDGPARALPRGAAGRRALSRHRARRHAIAYRNRSPLRADAPVAAESSCEPAPSSEPVVLERPPTARGPRRAGSRPAR
jgi:hypothetical protein